jgi:hypothetical protein
MELPEDAIVKRAVSIHGGGVESYDFHCLEVLQSVVEARRGGETGISAVQFLDRDALWKTLEADDKWAIPLADAAMAAELGPETPSLKSLVENRFNGAAHAIRVHYVDGLQAFALKIGDSGIRWNFACQVEGIPNPLATAYHVGPWQNRNLFRALSHAIQLHFTEKKTPYPVERTLLVTGALDAAMDSLLNHNSPVHTPQLAFNYTPIDFRRCREMGKTWDLITPDTPEPEGIDRITQKLAK